MPKIIKNSAQENALAEIEKALANIKEINEMDLGNMTPLDALNTLYRIQAGLNNRYSGEGQ